MNTYFGTRGYTILKSELSHEQQHFLKQELTARPFTQGGIGGQQITYPVYRESTNKYFVPRYFGESNYGLAKECKLKDGDAIDVAFTGSLKEAQIQVVDAYVKHIHSGGHHTSHGGGGLLELYCGFGKTVVSLNIISQLKKKTLIIVHKEFLMNQWIERIQQFIPSARVGKIQGQIIDIENKDIVLGMLQSLSQKEYPDNMFQSFGLTIIDEVHHISSEVFSCALFKIVTKYTLGLSATMERKDGTTKIFKMFLGEVVYKIRTREKFQVVVRGIEYIAKDEEFNTIVYDYRGNVQYSTMISKLCAYNHRTEFILKVVVDLLKENPDQQILVLAHNKCVLKYMYDAIEARNIALVGYYLGGMKETALKQSESKKIIIATFSMASEALDIKTLTTLIMATPKTEIEQCVGRILREKHGQPIIVDIIDKHQTFKNQWQKRKAFYKKQDYKIISTTNLEYTTEINKWKVLSHSTCENEEEEENGGNSGNGGSSGNGEGKCLIKIKKC